MPGRDRGGRCAPYVAAVRLIAATADPLTDGRALLAGCDLTVLPLARACNVVWAVHAAGLDVERRAELWLDLLAPHPNRAATTVESGRALAQAEMDLFRRRAGQAH